MFEVCLFFYCSFIRPYASVLRADLTIATGPFFFFEKKFPCLVAVPYLRSVMPSVVIRQYRFSSTSLMVPSRVFICKCPFYALCTWFTLRPYQKRRCFKGYLLSHQIDAEFNMFLDPVVVTTVLDSSLDTTHIPLASQRKCASFQCILQHLKHNDHTPESSFVHPYGNVFSY